MRILCIAPFPVLPVTAGGKVRIVELARHLSRKGAEVTVLAPFHPLQTRRLARGEPFELEVFVYPLIVPMLLFGRRLPYGVSISVHPGLGLLLRGLLRRFDVIHFEHAFLAGLLGAVSSEKIVTYDAHNVDSDYVESECRTALARRIARWRMRALEGALLERADHVFACSEEDRARFRDVFSVTADKISVAPNGIRSEPPAPPAEDVSRHVLPGLDRYRHRLLFSGSDVRHNVEAVEFLLRDVAPRIDPEWAVVLNGSVASAVRSRSRNVFCDPDFANYPALAGAGTVAVNPVEQGSGTNLKLTHALAHSLPVLSTPFGVRGYDDLRRYVSVRARDEFVPFLRAAATDGLATLPKPPAFAELEQLYGWERVATGMMGHFERLLASASRAGSHGETEPGMTESAPPQVTDCVRGSCPERARSMGELAAWRFGGPAGSRQPGSRTPR